MSSTFSRPFLEENDVSGQVVKSIYVEGQVYDGQTQRTEQTMVPFAAVRAKHMVSKFTEVFQSSSNFISSHPFEKSSLNIVHDSLSDYDFTTITYSDADNTTIQNNRTIHYDFNNLNNNEKLVKSS